MILLKLVLHGTTLTPEAQGFQADTIRIYPFSLYICPNWHVIFPFVCRFIVNVLLIVVRILWNHEGEEKYLRRSKHVGLFHSYLSSPILKNRVDELSCIFPDYVFFGGKKPTTHANSNTEPRRSSKCYNPPQAQWICSTSNSSIAFSWFQWDVFTHPDHSVYCKSHKACMLLLFCISPALWMTSFMNQEYLCTWHLLKKGKSF